MARTIFYIDANNIDNTNTLLEDVIKIKYPQDQWGVILTGSRYIRNSILRLIKDLVDLDGTAYIKEFSGVPPMIYDDKSKFDYGIPEISTDLIIIKEGYSLPIINDEIAKIPEKYAVAVEALDTHNLSVDTWDKLLDDIFFYHVDDNIMTARVQKIIIEDGVGTLKRWANISDSQTKEMIKAYNKNRGIPKYVPATYWQEPISLISKNYWEKFSFVLTINDYEIYDPTNQQFLDVIAEKYFNDGYFDEIVIKLNYFYWFDDFQRIVDWTEKNLRSALVSYRFDTIFSNDTKNRYYDEEEAQKYGDVLRKNTIDEELEMFDTRLPVLLNQIIKNPQTYGFELHGGYMGKEGFLTDFIENGENFDGFRDLMCKMLTISPFAKSGDNFKGDNFQISYIDDDNKKTVYFCMKR